MMTDRESNHEKSVAEKFPEKPPRFDTDELEIVLPDFPVSRRTPAFNFIVYPFHHLISAAPLPVVDTSSALSREERRRAFWQSLVALGTAPAEAALLDDSLNRHLIERTPGAPIEIEWEVLYFHDLQGCAELYRTELLVWKRLIYNADDELPAVVELDAKSVLEFPDLNILVIEKPRENYRLFLDNLTAPFDLAFSTQILQAETTSGRAASTGARKKQAGPQYLSRFCSYGARRTKNWIVDGNPDDLQAENTPAKLTPLFKAGQNHFRSNMTFHIWLTDYWSIWRQAARSSRFDFDYLENIAEAPTLRFYELTKLWRALSVTDASKGLPAKMEIEYEKFAALMPLPLLNSEKMIKEQIARMIEPLKEGGYVKSFGIKGSLQDIGWRRARLVFRFGD